ncbi:putative disease resistance RPP13-like protein 1 [Medicago truncatula]|nr:putative disease resistance RPP13-like protein 1 [Medicago truncatula]
MFLNKKLVDDSILANLKKTQVLTVVLNDDDDVVINEWSVALRYAVLQVDFYNDPEVHDKFELKLWRYISNDFDIFRVYETILESITSQTISNDNTYTKRNETSDLNIVFPQFLLILDDVLDARCVNWTLLIDILNAGKRGSEIIITTRDERLPKSMQTFSYVHYLRPLESEDCWSLVARHAFGACNEQQRSNLEEVGKKIAKKCDGLPLAVIELAEFLHIELSPDYWNNVLIRDIWEFVHYKVQPALQLSYHYLSAPLKQCFEYCSIFPKKSILEKNVVVQLWITRGLVESSADQEKVGEEYFDELVSRSLINRQSIGDEEEIFEMYSLTNELATMISSSYCTRLDEQNLHERIHNLSYNRGLYDSFNKFDKLYAVKGLRTFLALPLQKQLPFCLLSNKVVHDLLPTMKQLRVLSLSNYRSITEIPNSIENLLCLRYLNLSHTKIERLPSATCKLYNLQFLLLAGCRKLIEFPEDMGKLVNLRHLDISDSTALREMPVQIAKLENFHTLSDFVVGKQNDGLKVAELENFPTYMENFLSHSYKMLMTPLKQIKPRLR